MCLCGAWMGNRMRKVKALSSAVFALALAAPLAPASATPISDQTAADIYKSCYDYCIGGLSEEDCRQSCTCQARLTQKRLTLEEAMAIGQGTASAEVMARMEAITKQCSG
jgi:hypothetical protein